MTTTDKLHWFKSSYSGGEGGNCIEVALHPQAVHIRDTKDKGIHPLVVRPTTWAAFTSFWNGCEDHNEHH